MTEALLPLIQDALEAAVDAASRADALDDIQRIEDLCPWAHDLASLARKLRGAPKLSRA